MKIFLIFLTYLSAGFATEVYFSPSPDCENRIVKAINESKQEIEAAVYSINNRKISEALVEAKRRGVKIRVLTDHTQASGRSTTVFDLLAAGIDLRVHSKHKIEHNKFGIYDHLLVSTGSFNWTGPAARSNSENCLFVNEAAIVAKYQERFEFLWQKNTADGSMARISKLQVHRHPTAIRK